MPSELGLGQGEAETLEMNPAWYQRGIHAADDSRDLWPEWNMDSVAVPGPGPIGIIAWKHELLVVPFSGEWAA
jgi:hypothetical protein